MRFTIETEAEEDGRWIAEIVELPGVIQYGESRDEAIARAEALALRVLATPRPLHKERLDDKARGTRNSQTNRPRQDLQVTAKIGKPDTHFSPQRPETGSPKPCQRP